MASSQSVSIAILGSVFFSTYFARSINLWVDLLSEVEELKKAQNDEDRKSEIGDILFSVVNICRYLEADPEIQLNKSTQRFIERAKYVEKNTDPSIDIETLWEEAKKSQLK